MLHLESVILIEFPFMISISILHIVRKKIDCSFRRFKFATSRVLSCFHDSLKNGCRFFLKQPVARHLGKAIDQITCLCQIII